MNSSTSMGAVIRIWAVALICFASTLGAALPADAQRPLQQVLDLNRQAMEAYTNLDIEAADRYLKDALDEAERGGVTGAPLARTYLNLGVLYVGGYQDNARALRYFTQALEADSSIDLDPLTSTPEIKQVFMLARTRAGSSGSSSGGGRPETPRPSGGSAGNIPHEPVPEQLSQTSVPVFVEVPDDAPVGQVFLYHRGPGMREYKRSEMRRMSGGFGLEIPCQDVFAPRVEYYIVAFGDDGSPLGFAGSADDPVSVPIVAERTMPPPALPGKVPPEPCALDEECPPGMPGCSDGGNAAGLGDTCATTLDCREGLICDDNFCVADEDAEDDEDDDDDEGVLWDPTHFFAQVGFTIGAGWATDGMPADRAPDDVSTADESFVPRGGRASDEQACNREWCVRVQTPGFLPTYALRATLGYYIIDRLALAATLRFQLNAGQGTMANMLIGARLQYRLGPLGAPLGGAIFIGTSYGQIQLTPPQQGEEEPSIVSGLNGAQLGGVLDWHFSRVVGLTVEPEIHILLPYFLFAADLTLSLAITF